MDNNMQWDSSKETLPSFLARNSDRIFKWNTPENTMTEDGKYYVRHLLRSNGLPEPPEHWNYAWVCNTNKQCMGYVGTLPKRLSNWLYKTHQIKLSNDMVSQIGNIARKHTEDRTEYLIDFTNKFDWEAGDFGDAGSCFWSERPNARKILEQNGAFAMRFWQTKAKCYDYYVQQYLDSQGCHDDNCASCRVNAEDYAKRLLRYAKGDYAGLSRSWLGVLDDNTTLLFNSYPKDWGLIRTARILADILGCSYMQIGYSNNDGTLYVNGETAFMVADSDHLRNINEPVRTQWYCYVGKCCVCGNMIKSGYYDDNYTTLSDQRLVCSDCFHHVTRCDSCGDGFLDLDTEDQMTVVTVYGKWTYAYLQVAAPPAADNTVTKQYCRRCFDEQKHTCSSCGNKFVDYYSRMYMGVQVVQNSGALCYDYADITTPYCQQCELDMYYAGIQRAYERQ
jgi:hypothetical protein